MPALCAASRSATAVLAQIRYRHPNSPINLHRPTQIGNSKAAAAPLATSSTSPLNPTASDHFPYPPRSNPHSARRPAKRTHSRGFLPWRFSYAGPGTRSTVRSGRHPKTFTIPVSRTAAKTLRRHLPGRSVGFSSLRIRPVQTLIWLIDLNQRGCGTKRYYYLFSTIT